MAAIAPTSITQSLNPKTSPPTYDEVAAKVDRLVGNDPTPRKYLDVVEHLTAEEIDILMTGVEKIEPIANDEEAKAYTTGAVRTLVSDECIDYLRLASNAAVDASNEIERVFVDLQLKIAQIDLIHHSGFQGELIEHQRTYRRILTESRDLATDLAIHGDRFDLLIIPFCRDETIPTDVRKGIINGFISDMEKAQRDAREVEDRFDELRISFTSFVAKFTTWARDKEQELSEQFKQVLDELEELNEQLQSHINGLLVTAGVMGGATLVFSLAFAFGPIGFFIAIGGLIATGVAGAAATAALLVKKTRVEREIREKEAERDRLEGELEAIQQARTRLVDLGHHRLDVFRDNVNVLKSVWTNVAVDARIIAGWLDGSLVFVEWPPAMESSLVAGNSVYKTMAGYLKDYARGVST
ncbi:uncharacterized protein BO80DRAFT_449085 [Aspergillus ibericus CBS 121593]|uniref:Uncharacterized protein n=1 Tax=Aspergillus ibericus CBS 121593 TaxID=1448316 RepID=A0A395GM99_9EURO|nr:hypothetical protein BO80DRAFT_449085 [Aspergillus ibericus CBS 121593]RAK96625.1 hypothetical protein BO80DRAFT_449085 [Aspergillus ibericus CBS 121593]